MKISEGIEILRAEKILGKTPKARPLSDFAKETVEATLADQKNYETELIECLGCGMIVSSLLTSEGCPNCGVQDLSMDIKIEKET